MRPVRNFVKAMIDVFFDFSEFELREDFHQAFNYIFGYFPNAQKLEEWSHLKEMSYGATRLALASSEEARNMLSTIIQQELGILPSNIDYWIQRLAEVGYQTLEEEIVHLRKVGGPLLKELQSEVEQKDVKIHELESLIASLTETEPDTYPVLPESNTCPALSDSAGGNTCSSLSSSSNDTQAGISWSLIFTAGGIVLSVMVIVLLYKQYQSWVHKKSIVALQETSGELSEKLPDQEAEEIGLQNTGQLEEEHKPEQASNIEVIPEEIKTPLADDVPDTPSKRRLKDDAQNKILTELSESESDSVENTTLHEIVVKKNDSDLRKMLKDQKKILKSKEEFKSFINEGNLDGNTALHFAIRRNDEKIVKRLIREGANVNCKNNLGETPLHKAAKHGYVKLTKLLVDAGADIDAITYNNNTPMHYACDYLQSKMVEYLVSVGFNIDIENNQRMTAFELLHAKQLSSEQATIKKMLSEYKSLTLAKKIASKFRVICELSHILGPKRKKKQQLETSIIEICKTDAKFLEWASKNQRISEDERNDIAKAINHVTKELSKKDFKNPELIKDQIKGIIEKTISNITKPEKKLESFSAQVISKEHSNINSFRGALKELLHSSYTYYSLIICAIVVDPTISDNQLLEVLKGVAPLIISGAGQIVSSTVAPIPALQTGIQQSANIVGTLAPIAISGIQTWLAKKDNNKRKAEAQHFVDAFIDKNSSSISFFNRQIPRIDQIKLDAVVNTMTERFEDQLLQLRPLHAEMLAQHIHARIVKHLLDNRDLFEGESELWITRKGKGLVGEVQDHINPNRVKPTYLDLNKRCILAILRQGLGATHEQVLDINNKEVYLHGYIVWSGIKVKNKDGYDLYDNEDEKTRIQHELYGYCLGTKEEVDIRGKFQFSKFVPLNKDQKSLEPMRSIGIYRRVAKNTDKTESTEELLDKSSKEL